MTSIKNGQDNDLSEFDESRDIIESLVDEYKACESPDYIKWGMEVDSLQIPCTILSTYCVLLIFCSLIQDPNNMLTGEGNATGSLDSKSVA